MANSPAKTFLLLGLCLKICSGELDLLPDIGTNYSCPQNLMEKSSEVPTNVNSVRPADIKVVMALGDSLTAGNGAGALTAIGVLLQYRGLSFQAGGDKSLEEHITIPNILKKYNPDLFGYSTGIGNENEYNVAHLNVAVSGALASGLPEQANHLVALLKNSSDVNITEDWKLLNIFIGGNDLCSFCNHPENSPQNASTYIAEAIKIIYDNVPRVIVSLTGALHVEILRQTDSGRIFCTAFHLFECQCVSDNSISTETIEDAANAYNFYEKQLETSGQFEKEDFTLVVQPFFSNTTTPPMINDATNKQFFAPDCFHFSQWGHALVSSHLWKNILEPVGTKTTVANLSAPILPLPCPDSNCPYIRTPKNTVNCSAYLTA